MLSPWPEQLHLLRRNSMHRIEIRQKQLLDPGKEKSSFNVPMLSPGKYHEKRLRLHSRIP